MQTKIKVAIALMTATILGAMGTAWGQSTYTRTANGTNLSGDNTAWNPAGIPGTLDIAAWASASQRSAAGNLVNTDITWAGITVAGGGELNIGNDGNSVLSIGAAGIDLSAATATGNCATILFSAQPLAIPLQSAVAQALVTIHENLNSPEF